MSINALQEYIDTQPLGIPSTNSGSLSEMQMQEYNREGYLVLPNLVRQEDMAPVRKAIQIKVSRIADEMAADGLISNKWDKESFETRLARIFQGKKDADFLKY